jgi:hypothetical protein
MGKHSATVETAGLLAKKFVGNHDVFGQGIWSNVVWHLLFPLADVTTAVFPHRSKIFSPAPK